MTSAPTNPVEVPPFQIQTLVPSIKNARSACAHGSEIYVGCDNGQLIRFALQADSPDALESYQEISRQTLPGEDVAHTLG